MRAHLITGLFAASLLALPLRGDGPSPETLIEAGHWKRARPLIEQRLGANGNDANAIYLLARYKQATGDPDGALPLAEKACALDSKNADYRLLLAQVYGQKAQTASVFSQFGLARRFKKEAEAALALDPNHIPSRLALIEYHLLAPGIAGGDKAKARVLADEIMKIDPARGYLALARIASFEKRTDQLESLYRKAVESNPGYYQALMAMAGFYGSDSQKKYDLAEKYLRDALRLDPDRISAHAGLASLLGLQERWQELDAGIVKAEKSVPDNLYPYYQVGNVLLRTGKDLPRAERYFRKYLTQEPEPGWPLHAHAYWRLGLVLEKQSRKPESVAALETSVRMKPDLEAAKKDLKRLK